MTRGGVMSTCIRIFILAVLACIAVASTSWADCAADCAAAYRSCRGNPDTCLSQQGVCLSRCGLSAERHGAIAYSEAKETYGYSYDFDSVRAASQAALDNCRREAAGASDCKVTVTFRNACGAIALGNNGAYGTAWALSRRDA